MAKEHSVYELNRIQQYIMQMRPVLKKEALFSDGTKDYRNPTEPEAGEKVTIRFRTGKNNVDIVWLCTDCEHYKMKKTESDREFDYYAVEMTMGEEPFYYYFEVASGLLHVFFDRYGVSKERRDAYRFCIIRRPPMRSGLFRGSMCRSGYREPSCTRSLWIVFTMVIRLTMY